MIGNILLDLIYLIAMEFKDRILIDGCIPSTITHSTPKAICLEYDGKNNKCNTWIPRKLITINHSKDIIRHYRSVKEINISLPKWFIEKELRLVLIPLN